jgi:hypothetical protein
VLGRSGTLQIEEARAGVEKAVVEYARGGSLQKLNAANRALADAHCYWREAYGLNVQIAGSKPPSECCRS